MSVLTRPCERRLLLSVRAREETHTHPARSTSRHSEFAMGRQSRTRFAFRENPARERKAAEQGGNPGLRLISETTAPHYLKRRVRVSTWKANSTAGRGEGFMKAMAHSGFALQLCALRYLGFVPDPLRPIPTAIIARLAQQLGTTPESLVLPGTVNQGEVPTEPGPRGGALTAWTRGRSGCSSAWRSRGAAGPWSAP
jgi:hypothetical protein